MKTKNEILQGTKNVKSAKFADKNTLKIEYENGNIAYRFHNTDIITITDKGIVLNSGGWKTITTKERINKFSPAGLYQENNIWYLRNGNIFFDGCIINHVGTLLNKPKKLNETKFAKLKKEIDNYCKLITKDNLPVPENGDCWYCLMFDKEGKQLDHLLQHVKEKYLHGSILVNAMREMGYSDTGIGLYYHLKDANVFKRSVKKYLTKRLILNFVENS